MLRSDLRGAALDRVRPWSAARPAQRRQLVASEKPSPLPAQALAAQASTSSSLRSWAILAPAFFMIAAAFDGPVRPCARPAAPGGTVSWKARFSIRCSVIRPAQVGVGQPPVVVEADVGLRPPRRPSARATARPMSPPPQAAPRCLSRSYCSSRLATVQPPFSGPNSWSFGTFTSVKKVSQKGDGAVDQQDRPHLDARRLHVDQQEADPLVLLRRVGAHQAEAPVGVLGAGSPDLLSR